MNKKTPNRDDFSAPVRRAVAARANYHCSFPDCLNITTGPSQESDDAVSRTGAAAHINAASPGGKRYLVSMTQEDRKSINNAIWMCSYHANLIDQDDQQFTAAQIRKWKSAHEARISAQQRGVPISVPNNEQEPLVYTLEFEHMDGWTLVLEDTLPVPDLSNRNFDAYKWLLEQGAASYLETILRLRIRNTLEHKTAVIFDMRLEIEHGEPYSGVLINSESAGDNSYTIIGFDLDKKNPRPVAYSRDSGIVVKADDNSTQVRFFRDRFITIESQSVYGFSIIGWVTKHLARWRLIIDYEVDGSRLSLLIDNNGRPFITSGEPNTPFKEKLAWAWWLGNERRFVPIGWYPDMD